MGIDAIRSPGVITPVRLSGSLPDGEQDAVGFAPASGAERFDRLRQRELLARSALQEAPAPHLAPHLEPAQFRHVAPRRERGLALEEAPDDDPVAGEELTRPALDDELPVFEPERAFAQERPAAGESVVGEPRLRPRLGHSRGARSRARSRP